jgi:hypothetical protein
MLILQLFLKKIYYSIVLFGASTKVPNFIKETFKIEESSFELGLFEKFNYLFKLVLAFMPVAWVLNTFNLWFVDNKIFFQVLVWTIIANIVAGGKVHWDNHTFKLKTLLWKNIEMCIIILFTYPILEGINRITGDNLAGDVFQWAIQIGTILYPGSKAIKNLHIWSNGKYPPAFLMEKIYKFEKDGDVKDFLNKN